MKKSAEVQIRYARVNGVMSPLEDGIVVIIPTSSEKKNQKLIVASLEPTISGYIHIWIYSLAALRLIIQHSISRCM